MATTKKATKRAKKPEAPQGKVAQAEPVEKKTRKRRFTPQRLNALLDEMLGQFADQVESKEVKFTANEGLKIYQIRKDMTPVDRVEVDVGWVEPEGECDGE